MRQKKRKQNGATKGQSNKNNSNPNQAASAGGKAQDLVENLQISLEVVKEEKQETLSRFKTVDSKLNILLVFVSGLLACLNVIFPFDQDISALKLRLSKDFLIHMLVAIFVSVLCILIGLYPRSSKRINESEFTNLERHSQEKKKFLGGYIATYTKEIESVEKAIKRKQLLFKIAFILLIIAFVLFSATVLINFL